MQHKAKLRALTISALLAVPFLDACHSSDLGSQKPDKVNLNPSLTADAGAMMVIAQKCANCHTSHRSSFVPDNTPHELDGIDSLDFFKNPNNRGIAKMMRKRIESTDATRQMPPKFATPLYDDERVAVLAFLATIEDGQVSPKPCTQTTALVGFNRRDPMNAHGHADDDDDDDIGQHEPGADDNHTAKNPQSGQEGGTASIIPEPCGSTQPTDPTDPPAKVTFNDVAGIVKANCASCHNGTSNFSLKTREDFVSKKPFPLDEIQAGSMPLRNPGFKDTADGKLLIQWLQGTQAE